MRGKIIIKKYISVLGFSFVIFLQGCATTGSGDPRDPLEGLNRGIYSFNEGIDKVLFDPIGNVYKTITPDVVDKGVTNFFSNLGEISNFANNLLQLKIDEALSTATRFVFNSTIGLLGFFDISTAVGLPEYDEDFGQTLGYWGVGPGPYLMAPFFGPTTLRDSTVLIVDAGFLNPVFYIDNAALKASLLSLEYIDFKADLLTTKSILDEAALDEYEFIKNAYFEKRASQIAK